jgi:hypothetical protein
MNYPPAQTGADAEVTALRAFLAGQNLEKAGQFAAAAECYREVLRQTAGKRVPVKAATERLLARLDDPDIEVRNRACSVLLFEMGTFNALKPGLFRQTPCYDNGDAARWKRVVERVRYGYSDRFVPSEVPRFVGGRRGPEDGPSE